jgi:mono/diheme cytochrome c family protein
MRRPLLTLPILTLLACGDAAPDDPNAALVKRGRVVYETVCTACHARGNPAEAGPVGPALAGSSLALLEAKVLRNEYPPGHLPQRDTKAMIRFPHLEPDLPALHAYLASFGE